mgnify:CR=1 FL=1|jgi:hypothetical protein
MDSTNKLGVTDIERTVTYERDGVTTIAEVRQFDPIFGTVILLDPKNKEVIEFLYDRTLSKWKVPGRDWTCVNPDWEVPIEKQLDTGSTAPNPVSRFPSSPL